MRANLILTILILFSRIINAQEMKSHPGISDFQSIELGKSIEVLIGGAVNTFTGNAQYYLNTGGGMKVDAIFMGQKKFGAGMAMSFYGNGSKKDYPINSMRPQASAHTTLFVGLAGQWVMDKREKRELRFQFEANYIQQNLNKRIEISDRVDRFNGVSPGFLVHYMIKLGYDHVGGYLEPIIMNSWLNFHVGIRPLLYNSTLPNGIMIEGGISYKLKTNFVKSYVLKD